MDHVTGNKGEKIKKEQNDFHPNKWRVLRQRPCPDQWLVYFLKLWLRRKILCSVLDQCLQTANRQNPQAAVAQWFLQPCCWTSAAFIVRARALKLGNRLFVSFASACHIWNLLLNFIGILFFILKKLARGVCRLYSVHVHECVEYSTPGSALYYCATICGCCCC